MKTNQKIKLRTERTTKITNKHATTPMAKVYFRIRSLKLKK